jgi:hypothetical protein
MSVNPERIIAVHEAAHSVIQYRADDGVMAESISIVATDQHLGISQDNGSTDSFNVDSVIARLLSIYAGGHAQRLLDPSTGDDGCDGDDVAAAECLDMQGLHSREAEFRESSKVLVEKHWPEILAVADEVQKTKTLDATEVSIIADIVTGEASTEDLVRYRLLRYGPQDVTR